MTQKNYDSIMEQFMYFPAIDRTIPVEKHVDPGIEGIMPYEEVKKFLENYGDIAVANWKGSFLSKKLNEESLFVSKIIYCDNNPEILSNINTHPDLILCRPNSLKQIIEELKE